jgi:hypothetical protein
VFANVNQVLLIMLLLFRLCFIHGIEKTTSISSCKNGFVTSVTIKFDMCVLLITCRPVYVCIYV